MTYTKKSLVPPLVESLRPDARRGIDESVRETLAALAEDTSGERGAV